MMNQLMNLNENGKVTSLELVEQINFFRRLERENGATGRLVNDLRHDNLRAIIKDEFDEEISLLELKDTPYIHPQNKQTYYYYELTPSQAKQVLLRESKSVRKAVVKYIEYLENTLIETAQREQLQALEKAQEQLRIELTANQPKIDFFEAVLNAQNYWNVTEIAKRFGMRAQQLNQILADLNIQYKIGKTWHLRAGYEQYGRPFETIHDRGVRVTLKFNQRGYEYIIARLIDKGYALVD
ncbi:MAG: phage antirepressor KilAC domain-containing protein [Bacilli bacterium]